MERDQIQAEVNRVPLWRHCIELPGGIVTPGKIDTQAKLQRLGLPADLRGQRVLDIGCSDGGFSFECERRGAAYVLAVDNYSSQFVDAPTGFQTAHRLLDSKVEFQPLDLFQLQPEKVGRFDLVLFLGVLYHLRRPMHALEHLADLCQGMLVVETLLAYRLRGWLGRLLDRLAGTRQPDAYLEFFETDQAGRDPTNWWAPSVACLEGMLRSCGYCGVQTVDVTPTRGVFHAYHPSRTHAPEELIARCGEAMVRRALEAIRGKPNASTALADELRSLWIREFGQIKQHCLEARSKDWHKTGRWQQ